MIQPNMGLIDFPSSAASAQRTATRMSLSDALFTGTQQRVLALLFGQPDRSFYSSELITLARSGSGAVQRELARLVQSELITVRQLGNQKHYQANPQSPIFAELCAITRKTMGLAEPLREALEPLANQIRAAFVYGSVAKRQDTGSSDIDLMVVSGTLGYPELFTAIETLSQYLARTVSPTIYTPKELAQRIARGDAFVKRVLAQPKLWIIGGADVIGV